MSSLSINESSLVSQRQGVVTNTVGNNHSEQNMGLENSIDRLYQEGLRNMKQLAHKLKQVKKDNELQSGVLNRLKSEDNDLDQKMAQLDSTKTQLDEVKVKLNEEVEVLQETHMKLDSESRRLENEFEQVKRKEQEELSNVYKQQEKMTNLTKESDKLKGFLQKCCRDSAIILQK